MYWNNPLFEVIWPGANTDPIVKSFHNGTHCLFYNPQCKFNNVETNQRLADLVAWANSGLSRGIDEFVSQEQNHYDIANLVKLNMWIHDIRSQGIVKPWMMLDQGNGTFLAGTGDSRLKCLERIPEIKTVPAFITTTTSRAHLYQGLEPIIDFNRFGEICNAEVGQTFLFRYTDDQAPYGIYWYEYDTDKTRKVTPGQQQAVTMFVNYMVANIGVEITESWFDLIIDWYAYS